MRYDILKGIRVLDLSRIFTGPFASQLLGDLGANITKVEPPFGDDTRFWGPPFMDENLSGYFYSLNRNKSGITLNLKDSGDLDRLYELVKKADIVIENFKHGVPQQLKISYEILSKINPTLIYLSINGFHSSGKFKERPSYDIIAQAEAGIMSLTGTETGEIVKVGVPIADISAGMYGVIGILTALHHRDMTGKGTYLETDLFSSLTSWLTYQAVNNQLLEPRHTLMGTSHPNIVPYRAYNCKDDRKIVLAVGNDKTWVNFLKVLNNPKTLQKYSTNESRVQFRLIVDSEIQKILLTNDLDHWELKFTTAGIPYGKVSNLDDVMNHEDVKSNNLLIEFEDAQVFRTPINFRGQTLLRSEEPPKFNDG